MIKFFRKIRQRMLSAGKFRKYIIYAIGEIILVVFGILIALQINNWNENEKAEDKEIKLLIELKDDLIETKNDLITDIEKVQRILETTNNQYKAIIKNQISDRSPYKISQGDIFSSALLYPKLSAYEAIQSEGITIISNDNLRNEITDFYQLQLKRVVNTESILEELNLKVLKPYLNTFSSYGSTCKDCEDLYELYNTGPNTNIYLIHSADDKLVHILKEKFLLLKALNSRYTGVSRRIDEIVALIDQETNSKL